MRSTTRIREIIRRPGAVVIPGVYDSLSARICEMAGFEAVFHSGYGTSAARLGQPDIGLLTQTEMAAQLKSITRAVRIPVLGDSDNGFGNAVNAYRTVQEYVWTGAAGLFMEDQVSPKRCGHMEGKQVIPEDEMMGKLRAALDARDAIDPDFVVMYRTDAIHVTGFDDALHRAKSAVEVGVDMVFVEALETREQMKRALEEIRAPLMLNLIEGGKTPLVPVQEAEAMGFKFIVPALSALFAAARGMYDVMTKIRKEGVSDGYLDKLFTFGEFAEVVRLEEIQAMEERYIPKKILEEKYHGKKHIVGH
ncbi:MAG TPA: carboxyvinyl-carboxyphosphonate phosphorylmutase [Synergistaceae bacterium]|nr:carboxyvinyl-carboxyphosphonate phosphorylmutase [Synergistaceae bacterium]